MQKLRLSLFLYSFCTAFSFFSLIPASEAKPISKICADLVRSLKPFPKTFSFHYLDRVQKRLTQINSNPSNGSIALINLGGRASLLVLEDAAFLVWPHHDFGKRMDNGGLQFRKFNPKDKKSFSINKKLGSYGSFSFPRHLLMNLFFPISEVKYFNLSAEVYASLRKNFQTSNNEVQETLIYQSGLEDFFTSEATDLKDIKEEKFKPQFVSRRRNLIVASILWGVFAGYPAFFPQPMHK
jgi:hypothetical protein